jgi:hypothetical protein
LQKGQGADNIPNMTTKDLARLVAKAATQPEQAPEERDPPLARHDRAFVVERHRQLEYVEKLVSDGFSRREVMVKCARRYQMREKEVANLWTQVMDDWRQLAMQRAADRPAMVEAYLHRLRRLSRKAERDARNMVPGAWAAVMAAERQIAQVSGFDQPTQVQVAVAGQVAHVHAHIDLHELTSRASEEELRAIAGLSERLLAARSQAQPQPRGDVLEGEVVSEP